MICFVIYGVNIYVSKHKFNSFEKNVWYSYDFRWFSWKFSMILADFLLPGPGSVSLERIRIRLTKMKRIQTDPDPHHWFLEYLWIDPSLMNFSVFIIFNFLLFVFFIRQRRHLFPLWTMYVLVTLEYLWWRSFSTLWDIGLLIIFNLQIP